MDQYIASSGSYRHSYTVAGHWTGELLPQPPVGSEQQLLVFPLPMVCQPQPQPHPHSRHLQVMHSWPAPEFYASLLNFMGQKADIIPFWPGWMSLMSHVQWTLSMQRPLFRQASMSQFAWHTCRFPTHMAILQTSTGLSCFIRVRRRTMQQIGDFHSASGIMIEAVCARHRVLQIQASIQGMIQKTSQG